MDHREELDASTIFMLLDQQLWSTCCFSLAYAITPLGLTEDHRLTWISLIWRPDRCPQPDNEARQKAEQRIDGELSFERSSHQFLVDSHSTE